MTRESQIDARRRALQAAFDALDVIDVEIPSSVIPITGKQWARCLLDAGLDERMAKYLERRDRVCSASQEDEVAAIGQRLRPVALEFVTETGVICQILELLAVLDHRQSSDVCSVGSGRRQILEDARAVLEAAIEDREVPAAPSLSKFWIPAEPAADLDSLLEIFGVPDADLRDEEGSFCDSRVIAAYRLKLDDLQNVCDPIMGLIADHPPSVFSAVRAVRDLSTSVSPLISLETAREVRLMILAAFESNPARAREIADRADKDGDKERESFRRLRQGLRAAEAARQSDSGTESAIAFSILEAYRHMAEGLTRRWVGTMLLLSGLEGEAPGLGGIIEPAVSRLGNLGKRVESALVPAMRNVEAHDDVVFDEDSGLLVSDGFAFHPEEILERLTDLDILQRGFESGRIAALADRPDLSDWSSADPRGMSPGRALVYARERFGHAGQSVRSMVRNRDRLNITLDSLEAEACAPCFVALNQAAYALPSVSRFSVTVSGRKGPAIDLPANVLSSNWPIFTLSAGLFPHALPQSTFLPCLTWCRLDCESIEKAAHVAAWMALNDAVHAILDANAAVSEYQRLPARFRIVAAASAGTARLLPQGPHLDELLRAQRVTQAAATVVAANPGAAAARVLTDRIFGLRDGLGGPFAILPTLDSSIPPPGSYPHRLS